MWAWHVPYQLTQSPKGSEDQLRQRSTRGACWKLYGSRHASCARSMEVQLLGGLTGADGTEAHALLGCSHGTKGNAPRNDTCHHT